METSMITITEPNAVSREFDESIAPAVIRAWFATAGTPTEVLALMRACGLAGLYEYEDAGISVAYSDVPEIEGGEDVGGYAERIADWINHAIGASGDSRVHLCAATAEEA